MNAMELQLLIIIILYALTQSIGYFLEYLNYRHLVLHGDEIPEEFASSIDADLMSKSKRYTIAKSRFRIASDLYSQIIAVVFIFGGLLNWYNNYLYNYQARHQWSFVLWGMIFIMMLAYAKMILNIPFSFYRAFVLERRFGFNTMTLLIWSKDLIKGLIVSTVLFSLLLCGAFYLIYTLPNLWWLPVWGFFFIFSVFIILITPYVLEPLFNKFSPIEDAELETKIKELLKKAGIEVRGVFVMDASKRTNHGNAYFTGIGKVKRIVLYDNILKKLSHDEILAVLAHEAGHCKKRHVMKNLLWFEGLSVLAAFIAFLILRSEYLTLLFGLAHDTFFAKFVLLSFISSIVFWMVPLLFNALSRHFELQADDFACRLLGTGAALSSALVKLSVENLSNIHPQKLYAIFHYSHPPELERVRRLRKYHAPPA